MLQNTTTLTAQPSSSSSSLFRTSPASVPQFFTQENGAAVLEGHFNGEKMIGDDSKERLKIFFDQIKKNGTTIIIQNIKKVNSTTDIINKIKNLK
jgi:hypothetical protein